MSERLLKCPACKSGNFLNFKEVKDHAVSKETFTLCRCADCGLLFTNPRPAFEAIGPYYDFPEYYSHEDSSKNLTQWVYQQVRKYSIGKKVALIQSLKKTGALLDVGCGTGAFLEAAKGRGWSVSGVEPNAKARALAEKKLNQSLHESVQELPEEPTVDLITLFHVLEHVHELKKTLKTLLKKLAPQGYLIIAVPNHEAHDARYYDKDWAAWDVPRHLYHWNNASMQQLAKEYGLILERRLPMVFDAFYVSLLSEKYRQSSPITAYIKALYRGLLSNVKAKKTGNYSSQLYIYKKK